MLLQMCGALLHGTVWSLFLGPSVSQASQHSPCCVAPSHMDSGIGPVTCFGQWDISKNKASRGLTSTCHWGTQLPCNRERPDPSCERGHVEKN